jgi:uncharacterized protein YjbI with pentapeptide repeats
MQPTLTAAEKDHEEVRYWRGQSTGARAQTAIAFISLLAVFIAGFVAWQSWQSSKDNSRSTLRAAEDSQLSAAIKAIGSSNTSERVAGLLLLTRNTAGRFTEAGQSGELPGDVYDDYTTALQILSGYLDSQTEASLVAASPDNPAFGRGYGTLAASDQLIDLYYAADQVRDLLSSTVKSQVAHLHSPEQPAIDLSGDELYGLSWTDVDFAWVDAYMPGIDLRGADLAGSRWSSQSDLQFAYLQCSDLGGADFRGANLRRADLRGAYVQGADFRGAQLRLSEPTTVYGAAHWTSVPAGLTVLPASQWHAAACLHDTSYFDNQNLPTS